MAILGVQNSAKHYIVHQIQSDLVALLVLILSANLELDYPRFLRPKCSTSNFHEIQSKSKLYYPRFLALGSTPSRQVLQIIEQRSDCVNV